MLLVFASQKVHNVRDEMAEFVVPLRKDILDSLTRQGMQNVRGLHRKGLEKRGKEEKILSVRAHKQGLDSEKEHAPHFAQQH